MIEAFGVRPDRTAVTAHGAHFVRRTTMTRDAARRSLGIPEDELVFLAIGFIQPHKQFDLAVRAFDGLGGQGCSLHVVGSVRVDEPQHLAYLAELQALVEATPAAHLHNQYVSDEQFDRWLVASDVVVLPYRNIWSSGVLERALLYDRQVIATAVGGLSHQAAARPGVTLVDDAGLAAAMWRARGQAGRARTRSRRPGRPAPSGSASGSRSRWWPGRPGAGACPCAPATAGRRPSPARAACPCGGCRRSGCPRRPRPGRGCRCSSGWSAGPPAGRSTRWWPR